jgi:NAD(P)-dependent dehydrogenase (short-subunit alcohol dehydrogenase family)
MNKRMAVVTGAARGLGLAISKALLSQGCDVIGIDLDAQRLQQTAEESPTSTSW